MPVESVKVALCLASVADIHGTAPATRPDLCRSEEHTSELQSQPNLVCRLLLAKKQDVVVFYLVVRCLEPGVAVHRERSIEEEDRDPVGMSPLIHRIPHRARHELSDAASVMRAT